jgi:anti-sigma B factor antagonist
MDILSAVDNDIQFLGFVGSFDTTDVEAFQAHIEEAIDDQRFKVVINMGQMTFINSTALGSLIRAQKRLNQYGGDLAIAELGGFAGGVFKTLGIDRKIRCYESEQEARDYLAEVGAEGVSVDGEQFVQFSFVDDAELEVAGTDKRVGVMKSIGEQGLSLLWENLDNLDADRMFHAGARVQLEFQLPLYHETHTFSAKATVVSTAVTAGNRMTVQARFDALSDVERGAVQQYVRDLRYLKGELG